VERKHSLKGWRLIKENMTEKQYEKLKKEKRKRQNKKWNNKNRAKRKRYNHSYYIKNKRKIKKQTSDYAKRARKNKTKSKKIKAMARLANKRVRKTKRGKEQSRKNSRKRRAQKLKVKEYYTIDDEKYTYSLFKNICFNCKGRHNLQIDHIYPLSKGFALSRKNACVLCEKCNISKSNKMPEEFYTSEKLKLLKKIVNMKRKPHKYKID